jgi:hypothetical protein
MVLIGFAVQLFVAVAAGEMDDPMATIFTNGFGTFFGFSGPSSGYMLFAGGGEVIAMVLFLGQVEGKNQALVFARRTTLFRRAGLMALTLYAIQYLLYIPVLLLEYAFGLEPNKQQEAVWQSLIMIAMSVAITLLVSWAWEKAKFKGTLEWVAVKMLGKISHQEKAADRIDPKGTLYEIEPLGQPGESRQ